MWQNYRLEHKPLLAPPHTGSRHASSSARLMLQNHQDVSRDPDGKDAPVGHHRVLQSRNHLVGSFSCWHTDTQTQQLRFSENTSKHQRKSLCGRLSLSLSELGFPATLWSASRSITSCHVGGGVCIFGLEVQGSRVDAVPFPCGPGAVIKQVSKVRSTLKRTNKLSRYSS